MRGTPTGPRNIFNFNVAWTRQDFIRRYDFGSKLLSLEVDHDAQHNIWPYGGVHPGLKPFLKDDSHSREGTNHRTQATGSSPPSGYGRELTREQLLAHRRGPKEIPPAPGAAPVLDSAPPPTGRDYESSVGKGVHMIVGAPRGSSRKSLPGQRGPPALQRHPSPQPCAFQHKPILKTRGMENRDGI